MAPDPSTATPPARWFDRQLTVRVAVPDTYDTAARQRCVAMLAETPAVTRVDDHRATLELTAAIKDIVGQTGDCGPDEWARCAVDLTETCELPLDGDASRLLYALALQEWHDDLRHRLAMLGIDAVCDPTATAP